jgi:hypothetical protein
MGLFAGTPYPALRSTCYLRCCCCRCRCTLHPGCSLQLLPFAFLVVPVWIRCSCFFSSCSSLFELQLREVFSGLYSRFGFAASALLCNVHRCTRGSAVLHLLLPYLLPDLPWVCPMVYHKSPRPPLESGEAGPTGSAPATGEEWDRPA